MLAGSGQSGWCLLANQNHRTHCREYWIGQTMSRPSYFPTARCVCQGLIPSSSIGFKGIGLRPKYHKTKLNKFLNNIIKKKTSFAVSILIDLSAKDLQLLEHLAKISSDEGRRAHLRGIPLAGAEISAPKGLLAPGKIGKAGGWKEALVNVTIGLRNNASRCLQSLRGSSTRYGFPYNTIQHIEEVMNQLSSQPLLVSNLCQKELQITKQYRSRCSTYCSIYIYSVMVS